jgi:beta-N-acetylhexosaminidase
MTGPGRGAAIFGCLATALSRDEAAFFRAADPFGFILFARNIDHPDQVRRLTADLRAAVGREAPVLVDQEGGRVQRLRGPHWREWEAPLDTVRRFADKAAAVLSLRYRIIAAELRAVGIDVNCAPCLDLARAETHPFLRNRCLGAEPGPVAALGRAVAEALLAGGVLPVVKHIPGHGRAVTDSHQALPHTNAPAEELDITDFAAFRPLADLPVAMTGHVVFSRLDPAAPATTSSPMIRLIRTRIGFQGLLLTDDLSMQALSGDLGTRAAAALRAGCDVALHCNGNRGEMEAVADAAGALSPAATERAIRALSMRRDPPPVDIAALEAELRAIEGGALGG